MIKILLFAQLRELLNCGKIEFPVSTSITVAELKTRLAAQGDRWHLLFAEQTVLVAVNQVLRDDNHYVTVGDEVAFFPPVTGG